MNISVLGCGWLGLPLAMRLLEDGYTVKGSTTTTDKLPLLEEAGIEPFLIRLEPELVCEECENFWDSELLILNIPPGRRRENVVEFHTAQIKSFIDRARDSKIQFVIFVSSTSVYPAKGGVMKEKDAASGKAARNSGEALLKAEAMLRNSDHFDTTILRFGGLYGYDRHPAKYLSGKDNIPNGNAPVNLIHRDDCINILHEIISRDVRGEVFNAVSGGHPPKNQYYTFIAKRAGLDPPTFQPDSEKDYKVVSNRKLIKRLNYQFLYPNPMDALSSPP